MGDGVHRASGKNPGGRGKSNPRPEINKQLLKALRKRAAEHLREILGKRARAQNAYDSVVSKLIENAHILVGDVPLKETLTEERFKHLKDHEAALRGVLTALRAEQKLATQELGLLKHADQVEAVSSEQEAARLLAAIDPRSKSREAEENTL